MPTEIPWAHLRNPILSYDHLCIKDACCVRDGDTFFLFFSAFDEERSRVVLVTTRDFRSYSDFLFCIDGRAAGHIGMCSPDIVRVGDTWYLALNSWGDDPTGPNRLYYMTSRDLRTWSDLRPLAHELTRGARAIDAALAFTGSFWVLFHKHWNRTVVATAGHPDGPWSLAGDGRAVLCMENGADNGLTHENYQVRRIDGRWRLLTTDYKPHHPYLYTLRGTGDRPEDWRMWGDGVRLQIPVESFNTIEPDNAAALCDFDTTDGWEYLIYSGKNEERSDRFCGRASSNPWPRGWGKLALARSRDRVRWFPAGTVS